MRGILPKSIVGKTDRMSGIKSKDGGNVKSRILRPPRMVLHADIEGPAVAAAWECGFYSSQNAIQYCRRAFGRYGLSKK
ncbi:hypothetical protein ACLJYM_08315 [Rhizobium giardinii]|uniref:hypothetical protein n=1 Tax=Rhizobium giardinii TaxID=56731 RepID=UPI0039DFD5B4